MFCITYVSILRNTCRRCNLKVTDVNEIVNSAGAALDENIAESMGKVEAATKAAKAVMILQNAACEVSSATRRMKARLNICVGHM